MLCYWADQARLLGRPGLQCGAGRRRRELPLDTPRRAVAVPHAHPLLQPQTPQIGAYRWVACWLTAHARRYRKHGLAGRTPAEQHHGPRLGSRLHTQQNRLKSAHMGVEYRPETLVFVVDCCHDPGGETARCSARLELFRSGLAMCAAAKVGSCHARRGYAQLPRRPLLRQLRQLPVLLPQSRVNPLHKFGLVALRVRGPSVEGLLLRPPKLLACRMLVRTSTPFRARRRSFVGDANHSPCATPHPVCTGERAALVRRGCSARRGSAQLSAAGAAAAWRPSSCGLAAAGPFGPGVCSQPAGSGGGRRRLQRERPWPPPQPAALLQRADALCGCLGHRQGPLRAGAAWQGSGSQNLWQRRVAFSREARSLAAQMRAVMIYARSTQVPVWPRRGCEGLCLDVVRPRRPCSALVEPGSWLLQERRVGVEDAASLLRGCMARGRACAVG